MNKFVNELFGINFNSVYDIFHSLSFTKRNLDFHGATAPIKSRPPRYRCFAITLRHTTVGRTPVER